MTSAQLIIAYIISNSVALLLLWVSWKKKNLARILFAGLFFWAFLANWRTAHHSPNDYLNYGKYAVGLYQDFIYGEFAKHVTGYVSLIAIGQLAIALCLLARGILVKSACVGGILFLLAIAPLGFGSAFPFSIISAFALLLIYRHSFKEDIFRNKWFA